MTKGININQLFCIFVSVICLLPMITFATNVSNQSNGKYLKISNDVTIFYHDIGSGPVLLFIPGWTMSSEVFKTQMDYFGKKYRVIALDPRSQGRSSKTLENNNYTQHGADLARFIELLNLKKFVLIGWSWGCYDAYSYMRLKGVNHLAGFVCIDVSPKSSGPKKEWAFSNYDGWGKFLFQPMMYRRYDFTQSWLQSMVERKLTPKELKWLTDESFKTQTYAAINLAVDAIYADYRSEAIGLDNNKIPTMNFISIAMGDVGKNWLTQNAPHSLIKIMGKHMMFWEQPNEFNQSLDKFLSDHK